MFDKARLLYVLGWETDQLTNLQSLLLMSYYPRQVDDPKGQIYLISQAISLAYALGLHRDPASISSSPRAISLRKQLWWSTYIRERILTLDHGSPWIIDDRDHDVPMLSLDDFTEFPLSPSHKQTRWSSPQDEATKQRQQALILIEKAKLTVILGRLIPISTGPITSGAPFVKNGWPRAQRCAKGVEGLDKISRDLDRWVANMPIELTCMRDSHAQAKENGGKTVLRNHATVLLLYYVARNQLAALHWLQVASPSGDAPEDAIKSLWSATRPIISHFEGLQENQMLSFVQLSGPSIIRPLLLCVLLNQHTPFWLNPFLDTERIPLLFSKIGDNDSYFARGASYLQFGTDQSPTSAPTDTPITACTQPQTGSMAHNVFDDILDNFPTDLEELPLGIALSDLLIDSMQGSEKATCEYLQ
jgi:hypothetical protein